MGKIRNAAWEVLGGLLASGAIYLAMFVVILGPLQSDVAFSNSMWQWDLLTYVPYVVIGSVAFFKKWRLFGLTLLVVGLVGVIALNGFLFGLYGSFV